MAIHIPLTRGEADDTDLTKPSFLLYLQDKRWWKVIIIQCMVFVVFLLYSVVLAALPTLWRNGDANPSISDDIRADQDTRHANIPLRQPTLLNPSSTSVSISAVDVWFAMSLPASCDAFAVVLSFNRPVTLNWHYFISVRMMAFAGICSILASSPFAFQHPTISLAAGCLAYILLGKGLDAFHTPPPTVTYNARFWTLSEYTVLLRRLTRPWGEAIRAVVVTGGLGTVLHVVVPRSWSAFNPVLTVTFEAIFLRGFKYRRSPQYALCVFPFFHASVLMDWGLEQVIAAPKLSLSPWVFASLFISSRLFLDLHLLTIFRRHPEFQWARTHAVMSTGMMLSLWAALLFLEENGVPIVTWVKPISTVGFYFVTAVGLTAPAAYIVSFEGGQEQSHTDVVEAT